MAFPTNLTNAVDGVTEIIAAHVNALEAKVGADSSAVTTSLDYLLKNPASIDPGHLHGWSKLYQKPVITVGDTGYGPEIQDALTAIGSTVCTLVIPPKPGGGNWTAPTSSFPANISLKFEAGAVVDYTAGGTAVKHGSVTAIAIDGTKVKVSATSHGLNAGDWVKLVGIRGVSSFWQWRTVRILQQVDSVNNDNFWLSIDATGWGTCTETGITFTGVRFIKGNIVDAPYQKIFEVDSPCLVFGNMVNGWLIKPYTQTLRPEWWGAVGDWDYNAQTSGTDDYQALYYCLYAADMAAKNGSWKAMGVELSRMYYTTETLSILECNDYNSLRVFGHGWQTGIASAATSSYPALEVMGTRYVHCEDFSIYGVTTGAGIAPLVGLMVGRSAFSENSNYNRFKLYFGGVFKYGCCFNRNMEKGWYDLICNAIPIDTTWKFTIGWGSNAEYTALVSKNVSGAGNTWSSFQNYYDRLVINTGNSIPNGCCVIYANGDQTGGGGIVTIRQAYIGCTPSSYATTDIIRLKGCCNLHLQDIVSEGPQVGGWFINCSSTFVSTNTIILNNIDFGNNINRTIQCDSNFRIARSIIRGKGNITIPTVDYSDLSVENGDVSIGTLTSSRIIQASGTVFTISTQCYRSDLTISGSATVTLPTDMASTFVRSGGSGRITGSFTMDAAGSKVISNPMIMPIVPCTVTLYPTNSSARTLQAGTSAIFEDPASRVQGTSFTVRTATGSAAGTESFNYTVDFH